MFLAVGQKTNKTYAKSKYKSSVVRKINELYPSDGKGGIILPEPLTIFRKQKFNHFEVKVH